VRRRHSTRRKALDELALAQTMPDLAFGRQPWAAWCSYAAALFRVAERLEEPMNFRKMPEVTGMLA
jgi:hypothetical protein